MPNFNVMKYTTNVFDGCDTWEDYISKFTDDNFITTSKYFRQVVFGNLNTKKIKALQTHITKDIAILLKDSYNVLSVNADEVIVEVETTDDAMNISKILLDNKYDSDNLRIECFKIIAVEQPIKFFIKDNVITKERKAYCVPKKYFGIGNAIVNKRAIADTDLFFEEDGMLHKIIL